MKISRQIAGYSLGLLGVACSSSSSPSASKGADLSGYDDPAMPRCNALESKPLPITLGKVVGAGKHSDGTLYVIDAVAAGDRAFVSSGTALQRVVVDGGGGSGGDDGWVGVSVNDPTPFSLKVELAGGVAQRMGVLRGVSAGKTFEIGTQGDVLELVPRSTIDALTLRNLPGTAILESTEITADGHRLAVIRPEEDWSYEDFRIFYGTDARMVERPLVSASRGSATWLRFKLDGKDADAYLPSALTGADPIPTLTVGGATMTMTEGSTAVTGLAYFCL